MELFIYLYFNCSQLQNYSMVAVLVTVLMLVRQKTFSFIIKLIVIIAFDFKIQYNDLKHPERHTQSNVTEGAIYT